MGAEIETAPIRVVLVDDNAGFRRTIRTLLLTDEYIEVVGEAGDGKTSLEEVERLMPDVVLMDCEMPGMDGAEATRRLHERFPQVEVIALSVGDDHDKLSRMRSAGAKQVLIKGAGPDEISNAIRNIKY
jgi:DNA-binding NarL/FixJ family response regulator